MGVYLRVDELPIYSYDFRNKTQAQVEADGWTVDLPFNTDSNGWYCPPPGALTRSVDLTGAKKLTIGADMTIYGGMYVGALNFALVGGSPNASLRAFITGNSDVGSRGVQLYVNGTTTSWSDQYAIDGATTLTYEINLQTYELTATVVNGGNTQSMTATTTASVINNILSSNTRIQTYPDTANHRLKTLTYTIE